MRVLLITSSYPRGRDDYAGIFVREQAEALTRAGWEVTVLAPPAEGCSAWELVEGGVELRRPPLHPSQLTGQVFYGAGIPDNLRRRPLAVLGLLPAAAGLAHHATSLARRCDVVLSHWLVPGGAIGALAAWRARRPHVVMAHSGGVHVLARARHAGGAHLARGIVGGSAAALCASRSIRDRLAGLLDRELEERLSIMPVGLRAEDYQRPLPYEPPNGSEPVRLLFVGRLVPVKGLDTLLEALGEWPVRRWTLTVVGDGPQREALESGARRRALPVHFTGGVAPSKIPALLHAHHVLVAPSRVLPSGRTEGLPRILLEALAAGLPVVAGAVGGIHEALEEGGGVVAPGDDPDAFVTTLRRVVEHPGRLAALSEEGQWCARERDWDRLVVPLSAALEAAVRDSSDRP